MEKKKAGRPSISIVRNRLVEILFIVGEDTAYNLHKHYISIFSPVSQRNVYYQLQKGKYMDIFEIKEIKIEKGEYSWGETARKVYYKNAKQAKPHIDKLVIEYFEKLKEKKNEDLKSKKIKNENLKSEKI